MESPVKKRGPRSEETKRKISEAMKGNHYRRGIKKPPVVKQEKVKPPELVLKGKTDAERALERMGYSDAEIAQLKGRYGTDGVQFLETNRWMDNL